MPLLALNHSRWPSFSIGFARMGKVSSRQETVQKTRREKNGSRACYNHDLFICRRCFDFGFITILRATFFLEKHVALKAAGLACLRVQAKAMGKSVMIQSVINICPRAH
jgi:hypothetical protein